MSDFKQLYKNSNQLQAQQETRRARLLEEQRKHRESQFAFQRDLREILQQTNKPKQEHVRANKWFKNIVMLSEWMMKAPEDIEDFMVMPCPKGVRCSLSTGENPNHSAKLYYKNGMKCHEIKTNLPPFTILDCIYNQKSHKIFVLDTIAYDKRDMMDSDAAFRFFWLKSKFVEDGLKALGNEEALDLVPTYDLCDHFDARKCFETFPIFPDGTELDGYLFYHKEGSYTAGETPLVLWLFPFMIDELLQNFKTHPSYLLTRPSSYTNYLDFIKEFDENMANRRKKKTGTKKSESMEHEPINESGDLEVGWDEIQGMIELEMTGNDV